MDLTTTSYNTLRLTQTPDLKLKGAADNTSLANKPVNMEVLKERATEFEAVFLGEMLKPMWEGLSTDSTFGGGQAEEIFRSMMLDEYATQIANQGGVGIGDAVLKELILMQEGK